MRSSCPFRACRVVLTVGRSSDERASSVTFGPARAAGVPALVTAGPLVTLVEVTRGRDLVREAEARRLFQQTFGRVH